MGGRPRAIARRRRIVETGPAAVWRWIAFRAEPLAAVDEDDLGSKIERTIGGDRKADRLPEPHAQPLGLLRIDLGQQLPARDAIVEVDVHL